jgi:hypothetical protein
VSPLRGEKNPPTHGCGRGKGVAIGNCFAGSFLDLTGTVKIRPRRMRTVEKGGKKKGMKKVKISIKKHRKGNNINKSELNIRGTHEN